MASYYYFLSNFFRQQIISMFERLKSAVLPGGISFNFEKELKEMDKVAKQITESEDKKEVKQPASIPLTEANARLLALGFQPTPSGLDMNYYRNLINQDPNIALAGLRIEVDILARNLAKGFKIDVSKNDSGIFLLRKLYEQGAITTDQMILAQKIISICNQAVHGIFITKQQANKVIDSAEVLAEQYLSWLSWGFDDKWEPGN